MVVLLDTNILLDVLQKREGLYETSFSVMEKCAQGNCSGYIAPHSVANIFFIRGFRVDSGYSTQPDLQKTT